MPGWENKAGVKCRNGERTPCAAGTVSPSIPGHCSPAGESAYRNSPARNISGNGFAKNNVK
jgi:hypothetical protein